MSDPIKTPLSRVFITDGAAKVTNKPVYMSCMRAGGLAQDFGDITKIECPSPDRYEEFEEIGEIQGAVGRATITLTGRLMLDIASDLLRIAKKRCSADVDIHFGKCTNPSEFNSFKKTLKLVDARTTAYNTDDLGALGSDEANPVNESADINAEEIIEILPLAYAERGGAVVTNELVDVIICDVASCGDCEDESNGCEKIYAVSVAAGGSAGTPPDLVYSLDGGVVFYAHDIDSLDAADNANGIACLGSYLVVISNGDLSMHYVLKSEVTATGDHTWTEIATGFVTAKGGNDIWSTGTIAFIVGAGGYVYYTTDPTGGVTVADAGVATDQGLNAVHALTDEFAVAVGDNGAIVMTTNGTVWTLAPSTPGGLGVNFNCVWLKSEKEWLIGDNAGTLHYTVDGGTTWATKAFNGSGAGTILDIAFSKPSIGYMAHQTAGTLGRILRTIDGGYSWTVEPMAGALPVTDKIDAIAVCKDNVNMVVGVGLNANGTDGVILLGQSS